MEHGTLEHRRIAAHATRVCRLEGVRRLMLLIITVLLIGLLLQTLSAGGLLRL
jgi:hypothetical protein